MKLRIPNSIVAFISILSLLLLQGCAASGAQLRQATDTDQSRVDELQIAILSLGASVEHAEARRAARVAIEYSRQQALEYEITGSPLFHNMMVNLGLKSRGLCVHWTRDLMIRLQQERFRSLDLHWAIANYDAAFLVEHSTVVVSARGEPMQRGLVLDGWRDSGKLYWAPVADDPDYRWRPRAEVIALKEQRAEAQLRPGFLR